MTRPAPRRRTLRAVVVVVVPVLAVLGGAVWFAVRPPSTPPAYTGPAPRLLPEGYVSRTHSVLVDASPERVWAWLNAPDLRLEDLVDTGAGFPPVTGTVALQGDWVPGQREGDRRRVQFADGHLLAEQVLDDTPARFRYVIWGFTGPQRFLVDHGTAEFTYTAEGAGTRIAWTYSFSPHTSLLRPVVGRFLDTTMSPLMEGTLLGMERGIEGTVT